MYENPDAESSHLTETVDPATLAPLIGALLREAWELVRQRMLDGLHARGFTDIHPAHLTVFQYPGPHDARPSELAARTRMSKQAINHLLGQMERLGYLTRQDDPLDQRYKRIRLTDRGSALILSIREIVREVEADWEERLGPDGFAELRTRLTEITAPPA